MVAMAGDGRVRQDQITLGLQSHIKERDLRVKTDIMWALLSIEGEGEMGVDSQAAKLSG